MLVSFSFPCHSMRLRFLMNFCGFQAKSEGSYLEGNDRALSADAVA
ncbi:hypothetical protein [Helicobacter bilis]|nr:hypothetical protein [Helicobacter bilis]